MRSRKKSLKHKLPAREAAICNRVAEARKYLELDQAAAARKIGIPKSTLSNYELCVVPLKVEAALRICRYLIISEEWLATGRFKLAEKVGTEMGVRGGSEDAMKKVYIRQSMDLLGSREAAQLPSKLLYSEAFDNVLAPVYSARIQQHFYSLGIPASAWKDSNIELGRDILVTMGERHLLMLTNEALRLGCSKEHAATVYLGLMMRLELFIARKCLGAPVDFKALGLPIELFTDPDFPLKVFETPEQLNREEQFVPVRTMASTD